MHSRHGQRRVAQDAHMVANNEGHSQVEENSNPQAMIHNVWQCVELTTLDPRDLSPAETRASSVPTPSGVNARFIPS